MVVLILDVYCCRGSVLFCRSGGTVVGGWLEKWSIKLSQLPTKLNLKLKLKPSLAKTYVQMVG